TDAIGVVWRLTTRRVIWDPRDPSRWWPMLEIHDLSVNYGGLAALRGVSLTVKEGQFVAIVGPNGAGKTTLFKAISGTVAPVSGSILFEGRDLLAVPPPERAHLGIAHVPEGRQVFASMTVLENLDR